MVTRRPRSVRRLVAAGDYRTALQAMALHLAAEIDDPETPPATKAALARELRPALLRLEEGASPAAKDKVDELRQRRERRRASPR